VNPGLHRRCNPDSAFGGGEAPPHSHCTNLATEIEALRREIGDCRGAGGFWAAIAIAAIALTPRSSSKLNGAIELHQTAMDGIEHELADLQAMPPWLSSRGNRLDFALPTMLIPLVTVVISGLRKHRAERQ
jgi:hypothetical protein